MGEKSSFVHLLDKIEAQDRRLDMVLKNVRSLSDSENMELAYSAALKLAEDSEKMTLLTRALPAYTGNPRAAQDMETVVEKVVPVEVGFTIEGWFCVRLPLLLPKKEEGSHLISAAFCIRSCVISSVIKNRSVTRKALWFSGTFTMWSVRSAGTAIMTISSSIWSLTRSLCM